MWLPLGIFCVWACVFGGKEARDFAREFWPILLLLWSPALFGLSLYAIDWVTS